MSGDCQSQQPDPSLSSPTCDRASKREPQHEAPRMRYRNRPVAVAMDPVSLVISECISITSAVQKHSRASHSSVSAILGGSPNPLQFAPPGVISSSQARGSKRAMSLSPVSGDVKLEATAAANNRWGLRGQKSNSMQDSPIVAAFSKLRHELASLTDIRSFDAPSLLAPFLLVIQTKGTPASITILALGALSKFLAYGFVCAESPRFALAMQSLSSAVTHCQFDVSDPTQGEVVLFMILHLMEDMMSGPGGDILSDESVCDMMSRGLAICSQPRFSPVLRRTAEASMVRMCQIIFEDIKHLQVQGDKADDDRDVAHCQRPVVPERVPNDPNSSSVDSEVAAPSPSTTPSREIHADSKDPRPPSPGDEETESLDLRPYSLPSVRELFRVLVSLLDPNDRQHTDTMRVMALRILHVALEVAGPSIACHPALATIAQDRLCCYIFQLMRSDNMAVLQESLIVAATLLATCRTVLKLQQELFLSYLVACLHPTVQIPREVGIDPSLYAGIPETPKLVKPPISQQASGRSTPVLVKDRQRLGLEGGARKPDARQAMVESIGVLSRIPTFIAELFVNYDCDPDRNDLCQDMVGLLSRNALPDSATWSTTSVPPLCLDALLRYIQFLAKRLEQDPVYETYPDPAQLREQRRRKKIIVKGTAKFNEKPKAGLGYLEAQGIIADSTEPIQVAKFLKGTSRVSKSILGDFLSKRGNEAILSAFMDQFDFTNKRIDEALRLLLETFRLPGEAPLIASIVECFADKYSSANSLEQVANKDAVFILTYAIIILNTDQHNPNLKSSRRMTFDDFSRNLRGQNDGKDFAVEYLESIFDSIKTNEIILPDEHDNKHAFDYGWKELLLKAESAEDLVVCNTNIYDADMFAATWRPIVSTLSYVFMSASDDTVFARIVTGFDECARAAAKFNNTEALDQIIYCLGYMSTLAPATPFSTVLNTSVEAGDGNVMVSELAVKLGGDFRAQLATLVLFRVVTDSEALLRSGWKHVINIWRNLFLNALIPSYSSVTGDSLTTMPTIPLQTPSQVIDRATRSPETGFFSAFTSYISSYAADDPPEPSEEELESTLSTIDCIKSCNLQKVFANIANLDAIPAATLVQALLDQMPEDDNSAVMSVRPDSTASSQISGQSRSSLQYDPSTAYILEFATAIAIRNAASLDAMGKQVIDTLQQVLRSPTSWHWITVSRATFYALVLLRDGYHQDVVNVPFLLHTISSLPRDILTISADTVAMGLAACTQETGPLRNEVMTSPDFWTILQVLAEREESAAIVFDIVDKGGSESPSAIIADNYELAVKLLSRFASAADVLAAAGRGKDSYSAKEAETAKQTVARACKAVSTLHGMTGRIPQLMQQSHLESSQAWSAYWLPILEALTMQCTNRCRDVRYLAFSAMQRSLLSPELTRTEAKEWTAIFGKVLFPLILRLLKPEVFSSDREGMSEMRVQSASLLCKVFLQYLVLLSEWDGMLDLWLRLIEILDRLMNSGQGDSLEEAVRENLKNAVLFLASSGYLVPPSRDASRKKLWDETWKRIDRFMPELKSEVPFSAQEADLELSVGTNGEKPDDATKAGVKRDDEEKTTMSKQENAEVNKDDSHGDIDAP
ncbi:hypothetical protein CDD82_5663 [Ophiocordyceps australis]|uniref:SEC7 domain-containing protein n=1 Tax=Ophiocordyceps australis TaxID=1399860 RepID=A0A2C5YWG4_9HYPO|nr:hypothetical protein CDD82_5663 [Ophiocordyceps australis]